MCLSGLISVSWLQFASFFSCSFCSPQSCLTAHFQFSASKDCQERKNLYFVTDPFSRLHSIKYSFAQRDENLNFFSTDKWAHRLYHLERTGILFFSPFLLWICLYKLLFFLSGSSQLQSFVAAALENGNICFIITTWEPLADSWQKAGSLLRKAQQLNNALAPFLLLKPSSLVRELRDSLWLSIPRTSTAPCSYKKCSELSHCTKQCLS